MKKTKKFLSIFAILFVAIFALSCCFFAACGSKDNDDDDTKIEDTTTGDDESTGGDDDDENQGENDDEKKEEATVTGVTVAPTTLDLVVGGEVGTLTATVTMSDATSYTGSYAWTSSGEDVATVTGNGATATVTAVSAGSATVTVTLDGGKYATCEVTVTTAEPEPTTVASEDELTSALAAGGDIVLGTDITGTFTVADNATVTLDLAGYSITSATSQGGAVMTIASDGSLTIEDSSESETGAIACTYTGGETTNGKSSTDNAAAILTRGTLVLNGGTISSTSTGINAQGGTVEINGATVDTKQGWWAIFENTGKLSGYGEGEEPKDVTVTINSGAVVTGNTKTIYVAGDSDGYTGITEGNYSEVYNSTTVSKLIVNGGTITGTNESAISTPGLATKECAVVEINGGTITGSANQKGPAVYIPNGILTIKDTNGDDPTVISGSTAVEIRGGTAEISGGTFTSTYDQNPSASYATSGATSVGYALTIYPYTSTKRDDDERFDNTVSVSVSGGTFNKGLYVNSDVTKDNFSITGGKFTEDPSDFVAGGYYARGDGTEGYTVVPSETITYTYDFNTIQFDGEMSRTADTSDDKTLATHETVFYLSETAASTTAGGEILSWHSPREGNTGCYIAEASGEDEDYDPAHLVVGGKTQSKNSTYGSYFTIDLSNYADTYSVTISVDMASGSDDRIRHAFMMTGSVPTKSGSDVISEDDDLAGGNTTVPEGVLYFAQSSSKSMRTTGSISNAIGITENNSQFVIMSNGNISYYGITITLTAV